MRIVLRAASIPIGGENTRLTLRAIREKVPFNTNCAI
jgi:hypothetical protein